MLLDIVLNPSVHCFQFNHRLFSLIEVPNYIIISYSAVSIVINGGNSFSPRGILMRLNLCRFSTNIVVMCLVKGIFRKEDYLIIVNP